MNMKTHLGLEYILMLLVRALYAKYQGTSLIPNVDVLATALSNTIMLIKY